MLGWVGNIEQVTKDNDNFRAVIDTGVHESEVPCARRAGSVGTSIVLRAIRMSESAIIRSG
jgi:hypothetical protein